MNNRKLFRALGFQSASKRWVPLFLVMQWKEREEELFSFEYFLQDIRRKHEMRDCMVYMASIVIAQRGMEYQN